MILIGALVAGLLAALLMVRYTGSVEEKAQTDSQMEQVLVVTAAIAKGEGADAALDGGKIAVGERPRADLPSNRVSRADDIRGMIAAIDLQPGEVVTDAKFANTGDLSNSNSFSLEQGMVALTVNVDSSKSVAGLLQPGDYVNVLVRTVGTALEGDSLPAGADQGSGVEHLFQKVKVLAVGTNLGQPVASVDAAAGAAATTTIPIVSDLITLEVPAEASQIIALAADLDNIRLTLVRPDYEPHGIPGIVNGTFPLPGTAGQTATDLSPVAPADPAAAAGGAPAGE